MTDIVLTIGPGHTLREAALTMWERGVGAAVVLDPEAPGPGVITERDILRAVAHGRNPDDEPVADHLTSKLTFARPDWSLEHAAQAMVRGGFRHLVVVDGSDLVGILSMRDIVRVWCGEGAACDVPDVATGRR
jgi:CBS domain-containing protein